MNQAIREALEAAGGFLERRFGNNSGSDWSDEEAADLGDSIDAALAALPDVERVREVCEGLRVAGGHLAGIVGPMRNSGMPFYEGSRDLLFSIEDAVEAAHHALFLLAYPGRSAPGVVCTDCGARLGAEHTYSGSKIQCSACAAKVTIPLPAGAALSPAEPPRQTVFVVESQPELDPSGTPQSPAEPAAPSVEVRDVHTRHCCAEHGCKYGKADCTVTTGKARQEYPCEDCSPPEAAATDLPPELLRGTFACPRCGRDTPHTHAPARPAPAPNNDPGADDDAKARGYARASITPPPKAATTDEAEHLMRSIEDEPSFDTSVAKIAAVLAARDAELDKYRKELAAAERRNESRLERIQELMSERDAASEQTRLAREENVDLCAKLEEAERERDIARACREEVERQSDEHEARADAAEQRIAEAVELFRKVQSLMDDADMGPRGSSDDEWRIPWTRHAVEVFAEVAMFLTAEPKGGAK